MKKSELRKIIREEIQKLNEKKIPNDDDIIYVSEYILSGFNKFKDGGYEFKILKQIIDSKISEYYKKSDDYRKEFDKQKKYDKNYINTAEAMKVKTNIKGYKITAKNYEKLKRKYNI